MCLATFSFKKCLITLLLFQKYPSLTIIKVILFEITLLVSIKVIKYLAHYYYYYYYYYKVWDRSSLSQSYFVYEYNKFS